MYSNNRCLNIHISRSSFFSGDMRYLFGTQRTTLTKKKIAAGPGQKSGVPYEC